MKHSALQRCFPLLPSLCLIACLFTGYVFANPALEFFNKARVANQLEPFKVHPQLEKAATNHANYMAEHNAPGHEEEWARAGFTGYSSADRAAYAGYPSRTTTESNDSGNANWESSASSTLSSVYHRLGLLSFYTDEIGMGYSCRLRSAEHKDSDSWLMRTIEQSLIFLNFNDAKEVGMKCSSETSVAWDEVKHFDYMIGNSNLRRLCSKPFDGRGLSNQCADKKMVISYDSYLHAFELNAKQGPETVVYPWPGQSDVYPVIKNVEVPNPVPGETVLGQPISVQFNPELLNERELEVTGFYLKKASGQDVVLLPRKDQQTDVDLKEFEFVWFSVQPLEWDTEYQVHIDYMIDNKIDSRKWSFATRKPPFSFKGKPEVVLIDHHLQSLQLEADKAYSLVLSPEMASSYIWSMNVVGGHEYMKIETATVVSIMPSRCTSIIGLHLKDGTHFQLSVNPGQQDCVSHDQ